MIKYTEISQFNIEETVAVTFGKFDGFHRGHQKLLNEVLFYSKENNINSLVCSFDMSDFILKSGMNYDCLMTERERELFLSDKVDYYIDQKFTDDIMNIEAEDFIENIIYKQFKGVFVIVGTDFRFGKGNRGDIHMLSYYQEKYGYTLVVVPKIRYEDKVISSTLIRNVLSGGNLAMANALLGREYSISGRIQEGKKIGRTLGFPTCNIKPVPCKILPPEGVYTGKAVVLGKEYLAVTNIGKNPTIDDNLSLVIESYLINFDEDVYGEEIEIYLHSFLRNEKKFKSKEELSKQMKVDVADTIQSKDQILK
ncbi:MAG: bifunctional riboflavin kinase/FAD synthetase [Lachnospiraceae bacterium]|jgi:riboflavin kinase/FMN adenylyltransferase|nr:bifunctional riboflavin kinase/FAD synthetase [Lachnospiraceae bacterium]